MKRLLLFILLTTTLPARGQLHTIFHYSVQDGLPSSEVYEIFEDKRGFLWFATDNGVVRFDGSEFQVFHVKDGLSDPVVFGFFEDDKGRIWFRTFSGRLSYLDGNSIKTYPYNDQLIKSGEYPFFNFVYNSKEESLCFTLAHVFGSIDCDGNARTEEAPPRSFRIASIDGKLLHGTDIRSSVKNIIINDQVYPITLSDTSEYKFFNTISCDEKIYVSIYKDLFQYENNKVTRILSASAPIISLSKDRENNLWIGYLNKGVENYTRGSGRWRPDFLKSKSVTKVFQDSSLGFWFTTLESGVYYVPTFEIENYTLPTTSRIKTVLALEDTVLMGDQAGNLFFFDADTRELRSKRTYKDEVYALFRDSFNNIWVSAGMDIIRYTPGFKARNFYPGIVATSFSEGSDGHISAYGGIRMTQFAKDGKVAKWRTRPINYRTMKVADTAVFFAGRTGLHVRNKDMELMEAPTAFSNFKITQIEFLNDTALILATQGNGLLLVNRTNWHYRQFDTNHQFLANNIYSMMKTDSTLWIGTDKGLVAISIEEMLKNDMKFHRISRRAGLLSDKVNFVLPVNNDIWAFGDNGFSVIPKSYRTAGNPIFYVKKIISGLDTLTSLAGISAQGITLPYENNHITFTFGYISFANQDIFLRYRISPRSNWRATAERSLQFLSLAPGDYVFELQHSMDNIHWNSAFLPLPFVINSPWWMKWYTYAGALMALLLLGYGYFRYRQSVYREKNHYLRIINSHQQKLIQSEIETLERERNRIAKELHDGVGTNLTAIKLMVNQLLQSHQAPEASDIEEQFQIALRELKDIIYDLTPPSLGRYGLFTALNNYVSKLNKSLAQMIALQTFGEEIRNYEFNIMVFRIIQELISNSIKHSAARHITIHVNSFEDMLNIVYEDDGVGFSYDPASGGLGLDNIESRIQSMNGTFKFDSGNHGISYTIDIPLHSIRQTA